MPLGQHVQHEHLAAKRLRAWIVEQNKSFNLEECIAIPEIKFCAFEAMVSQTRRLHLSYFLSNVDLGSIR